MQPTIELNPQQQKKIAYLFTDLLVYLLYIYHMNTYHKFCP